MISLNLKKRIITSIILLSLIFLMINFKPILIYTLIILGVISIIEFTNIMRKIRINIFFLLISNIIFIFYVFIFCLMFSLISNFIQFKLILYIFLVGCAASDIGGFIFGKMFKGPKLIKISPKKTVSGSIGSIIFTIATMSTLVFYSTNYFNYKIIFIAIVTSVACQLGDLFFSFLKRKAKIKDTGNFLPGHGGILDRIDGIFLGVPIGFLSLIIVIK
jgi:phosphatidate cytidylyltransferase